MSDSTQKALKVGLIAWAIVSSLSFIFGGIMGEIIGEGLGFSITNILFALLGAIFAGIPFFL